MTQRCISCGTSIKKSGRLDPYMCRSCEQVIVESRLEERYGYLDNY